MDKRYILDCLQDKEAGIIQKKNDIPDKEDAPEKEEKNEKTKDLVTTYFSAMGDISVLSKDVMMYWTPRSQ